MWVAGIIAFNEATFLELAVRSIRPFVNRIIIVEGAFGTMLPFTNSQRRSTDGTLEIAYNLAKEDSSIEIIESNAPNQQAQREEYLKHCQPNNIMFCLDADEIIHEEQIDQRWNIIPLMVCIPNALKISIILKNEYRCYFSAN